MGALEKGHRLLQGLLHPLAPLLGQQVGQRTGLGHERAGRDEDDGGPLARVLLGRGHGSGHVIGRRGQGTEGPRRTVGGEDDRLAQGPQAGPEGAHGVFLVGPLSEDDDHFFSSSEHRIPADRRSPAEKAGGGE